MNLTNDIMKRLSGFFSSYKEKVKFLKNLSKKRQGADEIILLVCCYIDQLGSCLYPTVNLSKRGFERMLLDHSGERDEFSLVSLGNLAGDILYMAETLSYIIPKPGRIQLQIDELKPLVRFVDQTGIALVENRVRKLLLTLHGSLKSHFRIHPYQTKKKKCYGNRDFVIDSIITYPELKRIGAEINADNVKKNLVEEYSYSSILYRDYRCKAVHEAAGICVTPRRFWKMKRPYFVETLPVFFNRSVFTLEFPSAFLIECLETCIECTEKAIKGKGLLPLNIWSAICDWKETEFLDEAGIEEPTPIRLRID
jgi:hypothetical protein